MLGWRYEIEQLDAPKTGTRFHSGMIKQDISSQVFWGDGCSDEMRDAIVNDVRIPNSGIPDFILIKDPKRFKMQTMYSVILKISENTQESIMKCVQVFFPSITGG